MTAAYQETSVGQEGVASAENHGGAGDFGEAPVRGIVELGRSDASPGEYPAGRQQVQMNGNDRPGKRRGPFPGFGLRLLRSRRGTRRAAILHRLSGSVRAGDLKGAAGQGGELSNAWRRARPGGKENVPGLCGSEHRVVHQPVRRIRVAELEPVATEVSNRDPIQCALGPAGPDAILATR